MPVTLNEDQQHDLRAKAAIIVYASDRDARAMAIEHPLVASKTGLRLGPGRHVSAAFFKRVAAINGLPLAFHPENVVASGHDAMAWYEPASIRRMLFRPTTDEAVATFDNVALPQPPLLFVAKPRSLMIYALEKDVRPTLSTRLYSAPYWNVFADHRVCTGSMTIPRRIAPCETATWTRAFFASNFTHLSSAKRWKRSGTYAELLEALRGRETFPADWLVATNQTLGKVLA